MDVNEERQKLYDETASLIADAAMRGQVSGAEMGFLLSLLDQIMVKHQYPEMVDLLKKWTDQEPDEEIDLIIKETLVNIDFNNSRSVEANLDIIKDLLSVQGGKPYA